MLDPEIYGQEWSDHYERIWAKPRAEAKALGMAENDLLAMATVKSLYRWQDGMGSDDPAVMRRELIRALEVIQRFRWKLPDDPRRTL